MKEKHWKIFYHGTTKARAKLIQHTGFARGTFFATHLEDAIGYGGQYVFRVSIKLDYDHTYWEYVSSKKILPNQIVGLDRYSKKELFNNNKLGNRIFKFNLKKTLGDNYRSHMARCAAIKRYEKSKTKVL